jgi:hypothetical protein
MKNGNLMTVGRTRDEQSVVVVLGFQNVKLN